MKTLYRDADSLFTAVGETVVPYHEQTLVTMQIYECRRCKYAVETYRAIDNTPEHAHLCRHCWSELPSSIQKCYIRVALYEG